MEFLWRPHFRHLGKKAQIFSHIIYDFKTSPFDLLIDNSTDKPEPTPNNTDQNNSSSDNNHGEDFIEPDDNYFRKLGATPKIPN